MWVVALGAHPDIWQQSFLVHRCKVGFALALPLAVACACASACAGRGHWNVQQCIALGELDRQICPAEPSFSVVRPIYGRNLSKASPLQESPYHLPK